MWILVILNGIGLFSGIVMNENVMYIVFAISFLAFFHRYAIISWDIVYERWVESVGLMDAKVANEFVCFFVMSCLFLLMIQKIGVWSIIVPIAQCIMFHIIKILHHTTSQNIQIMICYFVELLTSILFCFAKN